jgi:hypothetical protein
MGDESDKMDVDHPVGLRTDCPATNHEAALPEVKDFER